ncbi:MAG: phosphoenolpyruvate synthase/pyruvate phosphate dikinase [Desulfotalea sp.]
MDIDTGKMISDFDPHFKIFHELMSFKVQDILLVSSLYDAYILEEDGSLATRLIKEYRGLNLSKAPKITRASSPEEAIELVGAKNFDLVITMPHLQGMNGFQLGCLVKDISPNIPVILVAHNSLSTLPPDEKYSHGIDEVFLWCCEADLLLAIIKYVEDCFNIDADISRAMVRVIIYVEDSPTYRSVFLPLMYQELVGQTQSVLDESLNERHRLLRMRARPKILLAKNYEEGIELFTKYQANVFCVVSDARFPRNGVIDPVAGHTFLKYVQKHEPDMPVLMVSSEDQNYEIAKANNVGFINKGSSLISAELHRFFLSRLGFGDFVFQLPSGEVLSTAINLHDFQQCLQNIPDECFQFHFSRNDFSNWVMARAEVILARRLHRDRFAGVEIELVRQQMIDKVFAIRKLRQRGVVVNFAPESYDPEVMDFVKIGSGSMGGKARGLAFMWACLQSAGRKNELLSHDRVVIPKTCVIATDAFDAFIVFNKLYFAKGMEDEKIINLFIDAELPGWLRSDLRAFLRYWHKPFSVRSSSLLEDAQFKPYAGLYSTYFLANNHVDFEERLGQLESAVKLVYASTWFQSPQAFSKTSVQGRDDSMAVIIQELVGARRGDYWYPSVSGVAQSHNYYPVMKMLAEDGIAHIALGVGKTVVDGGKSLGFSPKYPKRLLQFSTVEDMLKNCQRQFYALDMSDAACLSPSLSNLVLRDVQDASDEQPVQMLSSTYVPEEHRIRDACLPGHKVMTFAQLLKYSKFPLGQTLSTLLAIGKNAMGCDVEIEFALALGDDLCDSTINFLQIRPMITGNEQADVGICPEDKNNSFCASSKVLGHGKIKHMTDIIYVDIENFDPSTTNQIALEIGGVGKKLMGQDRKFLLIGPGRWGTSDPWLGIPVQWSDIAGVGAIIEIQNDVIRAEPSQGSHFFQNITSLGIPYITVNDCEKNKDDFIDWAWLYKQPIMESGKYIRHVRLDSPFVVKCDGKVSAGVIIKNEKLEKNIVCRAESS